AQDATPSPERAQTHPTRDETARAAPQTAAVVASLWPWAPLSTPRTPLTRNTEPHAPTHPRNHRHCSALSVLPKVLPHTYTRLMTISEDDILLLKPPRLTAAENFYLPQIFQ